MIRETESRDGIGSRVRSTSLGTKVAVLGGLVTALVVGLAFAVLRIETVENVRSVFVDELSASQATLNQSQHRNQQLLLKTSALIATSPELRAALQVARDEASARVNRPDLLRTIQVALTSAVRELDLDLVVVADTSGVVLASAAKTASMAQGDSLFHLAAVRNALSDRPSADSAFGVMALRQTPYQIGCIAIQQGDEPPIGVLIIGERVDHLLPTSADSGSTRVVATIGDSVALSSEALAPAGSRWNATWEDVGIHGGSARTLSLGNEEFVTATLSLGLAEDGHQASLYLMRPLSPATKRVEESLVKSFLLIGLLALLMAALGGLIVSRTTLRPLSRFVAFMGSEAASANSTRYDDPSAPTEIATLTETYNHLIESLGAERHMLERRTLDLATTNETLLRQVQERQRAEKALRTSEEQLRQSQKLEALGALAGGVAHDFNNILSVILGYAEVALEELPADSRQRSDLTEIHGAGERAKGLVAQLLAFSRKQVLQPQVIDLNRIVLDMQSLLGQLIGENIRIETHLSGSLGRVMADPGQIEQVILNLVLNARDAMPQGGVITIETTNTVLEEEGPGLPLEPGLAVMLSVTDTGVGMDSETRRRVFEPFFTTKAPGQGTGLGLATVYGIVRQSGGSITVFSERTQGASFRCYFPPVSTPATVLTETVPELRGGTGTETILLAEDEGQLRELLRRGLQRRGYNVLTASDGAEALEVATNYFGTIDLLVTDMVMPLVSGAELAERLLTQMPDLRVLYISGYSQDAIDRHGLFTPGSVFLQKPIVPDALAAAVRKLLDSTRAPCPAE